MEILPSALSFRIIATLDLVDEADVPAGFNGRIRFLEHEDDGRLEAVGWYQNGVLHDPARRIPAYVRLRVDGQVKQSRHYRNGRLHDPSKGEPAVKGFFADGSRRYAEHYRYGRRQDSVTGEPAITKWRLDGSVRSVKRYPAPERYGPLSVAASN